jgi:hypothetical protein
MVCNACDTFSVEIAHGLIRLNCKYDPSILNIDIARTTGKLKQVNLQTLGNCGKAFQTLCFLSETRD